MENIGELAREASAREWARSAWKKSKELFSIFFFTHPYPFALAVNKSPVVYILSPAALDGIWRENRGPVKRLVCLHITSCLRCWCTRNLDASEMTCSSKNKNESHFIFILKFRSSDEHKELHVGDDDQMTVSVTVINKAQDAAYSGKVIVTFPSIIYYASSGQVSWRTKVLLRLATVWSQLFHFLCCHCTTWNYQISCFLQDLDTRQRFSNSFLNLDTVL